MTFDSQNKMNIKITTQDVLKTLTAIQDPDLHRDIVSLGFVKDVQVADSRVSFTIELTTPACPLRDQLAASAKQAVQAADGASREELQRVADSALRAWPA